MFEKREKKHSGSMEPVERTGNVWGKEILEIWNRWKLGISRVTEKKHSGHAELAEETGDVWENRRKHSGNVEPVGETGDVWEKRKNYSGNAELVETEDVQDNREKAFWKCRASGGNWRCLRMLFLWFSRHPQFSPTFPLFSPPALHFQNAFSLFPWIFLVSTSSAFPEYFFPFFPDISSSLHWLHTSRMLFLSLFRASG